MRSKNKLLSFLLLFTMVVAFSIQGIATVFAAEIPDANKEDIPFNANGNAVEVVSYIDVFRGYYDQV